ncbi:TATA element modulatory factor-like [Zophobas morio]|uniref:TATA element modulatory factor-like n=1 Tax=Zophobas morio TaxID=2755281 RepID=UPI003082EE25
MSSDKEAEVLEDVPIGDSTFTKEKTPSKDSTFLKDERSIRTSLNSTHSRSFSSSEAVSGYSDIVNILGDVLDHVNNKINTPSEPVKRNTLEEVGNNTVILNKTMDLCAPEIRNSAPMTGKENLCDQTITITEAPIIDSSILSLHNETTDNIVETLNETFPKLEHLICKSQKIQEVTSLEEHKINTTVVVDLSETTNVDKTDFVSSDTESLENVSLRAEAHNETFSQQRVVKADVLLDLNGTRDEKLSPVFAKDNIEEIVKLTGNIDFEKEDRVALGSPSLAVYDLCETSEEDSVFEELDETLPVEDTIELIDLTETINSEETTVKALNETFPKKDLDKTTQVSFTCDSSETTKTEALNETFSKEKSLCETVKVETETPLDQVDDINENSDESVVSCDETRLLSSSNSEAHDESSPLKHGITQSNQQTQPNDNIKAENTFLVGETDNITTRSDLEDSCREIQFCDALSCSTFENHQESVVSSPSVQSATIETVDSSDKQGDVAIQEQPVKCRKSIINLMRSKLADLEPYSPCRLELAAAFDNLKINTTAEESFLSCEEASLIGDSLNNDEPMDISPENPHVTKTVTDFENSVVMETTENDNIRTEKEVNSAAQLNPQNKSVSNIFESTPKESTECPALVIEDVSDITQPEKIMPEVDVDTSGNNDAASQPNSGNLNVHNTFTAPKGPRRSSGITISSMNFGKTPSPVKQHLNYLDEEYKNALTESPSVSERKKPQYERYLTLKLEINHLQQDIAKLTLELKQKEGDIMRLLPQKIKFPPVTRKTQITNTLPEGGSWDKEKASLEEEIEKLRETLDERNKEQVEFLEKIKMIENELAVTKKESDLNLEKRRDAEEKLDKNEATVKELQQCLNGTNDILTEAFSKLHQTQENYAREKEKHESTKSALREIIGKYEEAKRIVLAMKANEIVYEDTIDKLRSEKEDFHKTFEMFKNSALQTIEAANKEVAKVKAECINKNVQKKNSKHH